MERLCILAGHTRESEAGRGFCQNMNVRRVCPMVVVVVLSYEIFMSLSSFPRTTTTASPTFPFRGAVRLIPRGFTLGIVGPIYGRRYSLQFPHSISSSVPVYSYFQ